MISVLCVVLSRQHLGRERSAGPDFPYDYRATDDRDWQWDTEQPRTILSSNVGVVALTNTQTALTASSSSQCGTGSQLVDFVAYGSNVSTNGATSATPASCFAGSGPAYYDGSTAFGRQLGITRKNKCIDTFDNLNDFVNVPVTYFNWGPMPVLCPMGNAVDAVISATPVVA